MDSCLRRNDKRKFMLNLVQRRNNNKHISLINIKNMETEFLNHFASAMETCVSKVRFIFFPMNADQYGFSDLCIAYSLQKKLYFSQ